MKRIKFRKNMQRKFLKRVIERVNSPSLSELSKRIGLNYSTMKNYFNESRLMPKNIFKDFCYISKIDSDKLDVKFLDGNWGQIIGGKKGKRR